MEDLERLVLLEDFALLEVLIEFFAFDQLGDYIEMFAIFIQTIEFHNIRMILPSLIITNPRSMSNSFFKFCSILGTLFFSTFLTLHTHPESTLFDLYTVANVPCPILSSNK